MDGREFLEPARLLLSYPTEANRRAAARPLYLAALNEALVALERWGFPLPAGADIHAFALSRFGVGPNMDLIPVEDVLKRVGALAKEADHILAHPGRFASDLHVLNMFTLAEVGIELLEQIEAAPIRRAAGIAMIRSVFP